MPWQDKIIYLIGKPVGISLSNGQGTSGILCSISDKKLLIIEYLYQSTFAIKQYDFYMIQNIYGFPACPNELPLH